MTDEAIFEFGAEHDDDTYTIFFPDGHALTAWASGRLVVTKVEKNFRPFEANVSELRDRLATQREAIDELVAMLRSARLYVEEAVDADGGIDGCEIHMRHDLEAIDALLSKHGQRT